MHVQFKIIYTSDTHGRLSAYDFITKSYGNFGLSRLSSYIKDTTQPYLLMDNGDMLQGSPLLDYPRKNNLPGPTAQVFNALGYQYATVGNHDFNFGQAYLGQFASDFSGTMICANVMKNGSPLFTPFVIHDVAGVRVAIIGITTEYIPFWERKEHVEGLTFTDSVATVKDLISTQGLREEADLIVVLYHGGFERNIDTGVVYGEPTVENRGYELFQIPEVDMLLTGHQHVPQVYTKPGNRVAIQTGFNAQDAGVIEVTMSQDQTTDRYSLVDVQASILDISQFPVDQEIEAILNPLIRETDSYLSQPLGTIHTDMTITSALSARAQKHPLFQLINQLQLEISGADVSCASLPNVTHGFPKQVRRIDVAVSFPFENDLVVLELRGNQLQQALEQNARYFSITGGELVVNPQYLHPKVEHYNYDVYDGISYEMLIDQPLGSRISQAFLGDAPLDDQKTYTLAVNSYRATGAGGFDMFKGAKILQKYPISYYELICEYITDHPNLKIDLVENFRVRY
jgi:2',3'-cyclic-nucleotide 2'-phosphodiesterase/3'-nucleotidase